MVWFDWASILVHSYDLIRIIHFIYFGLINVNMCRCAKFTLIWPTRHVSTCLKVKGADSSKKGIQNFENPNSLTGGGGRVVYLFTFNWISIQYFIWKFKNSALKMGEQAPCLYAWRSCKYSRTRIKIAFIYLQWFRFFCPSVCHSIISSPEANNFLNCNSCKVKIGSKWNAEYILY